MDTDKDFAKVIEISRLNYEILLPSIQTLTNLLNSGVFKDVIDTYRHATLYLKDAIKFQKLTEMLNSGILHFPYPYTTETLLLITNKEKRESDIREDILSKLTTGKLIEIIEKQFFPHLNMKNAKYTQSIIKKVFESLADEENKMLLEVIWLFPISERIFQNFFKENLSELKKMIKAILVGLGNGKHDKIEDTDERIEKLEKCLENLEEVKKDGEIDLGTMLYTIELSLDQWDAYEVELIFSVLIISKFVYIRNSVIHGRLIKIQSKHVAIIISLFIMIINIILMKKEEDPILFEL